MNTHFKAVGTAVRGFRVYELDDKTGDVIYRGKSYYSETADEAIYDILHLRQRNTRQHRGIHG